MVTDETRESIFDPTKTLTIPRSHRAPSPSYIRPVVLLVLLALASPFLVTSVLPKDAPTKPLSQPQSPQTYAPHTFPTPPHVEPSEARTEEPRASRDSVKAERKQVSKVEIVISFALAQVGKRYVFGAAGPNTFDCSGLIKAAFATIGLTLYHFTGEMMKYGQRVARNALQRGDIVFPSSGHVGLYLGNGQFLHASSGRGRVVVDSSFGFYMARRLV